MSKNIYFPEWESLDKKPIPKWYDDAKLGIFIHWGIYSVPAWAPKRYEVPVQGEAYAEWFEWFAMQKGSRQHRFMKEHYGSNVNYEDLAYLWKAELFDADRWMRLIRDAGAKYVIPVTKHHDAFCLWPSYYSHNWNSADIGPHRNIIKELMDAADKYGITRGLYYSLLEFNNTHRPELAIDTSTAHIKKYAREKMIPQLKELVETFKPWLLFADGCWDYDSNHWMSKDFLTWLYNESSVKENIVVNDRWGDETMARHGGYYTCEYGTVNNKQMTEEELIQILSNHKYEECRSIGESFGFNRNEDIEDYMTEDGLIRFFVKTVSRGGNLNLNIGPCADGSIPAVMQERLKQIGDWLRVNGDGIYGSRAYPVPSLPAYARTTVKDGDIFIFCEEIKFNEELTVRSDKIKRGSKVCLLGSGTNIEYKAEDGKLTFKVPVLNPRDMPCKSVWTFKIYG